MPKVDAGLAPWAPIIDSYVGGNGLSINAHMITSRVWACPENKNLISEFNKKGSASAFYTGYPINRKLTETTDDEQTQGIPMARVQNPSHKIYVIESYRNSDGAFGPATTMEYTPYGYIEWMKQVHPVGNNVLFCDGHVECVKPDHPLCSTTVKECLPWWLPEW